MTIDLQNEHLLTLPEVAGVLPRRNGKNIHATTIWRWTKRGRCRVRLESVRIGGTLYSSREALQRFATRLSQLDGLDDCAPSQNAKQVGCRSHKQAESNLQGEGF